MTSVTTAKKVSKTLVKTINLKEAAAKKSGDADFSQEIAAELSINQSQVKAVLELFEEGGTVPFIARYRKEKTGSLDEVQIRNIEDKQKYLSELLARKETILKSIEEQGKLTEELRQKILVTASKSILEDLYLPFKPKRRTRATIAKEKGLDPLATMIREQILSGNPEQDAAAFVNEEKGVKDIEDALKGARDILAEELAEIVEARTLVRETMMREASVDSDLLDKDSGKTTKFDQYHEFSESVKTIPSHRYLAIRRGQKEGVLRVKLNVELDHIVPKLYQMMNENNSSPFAMQLRLAVDEGLKRLLRIQVETDVWVHLKMKSDVEAVQVFADNLRNLLLAAPLGNFRILGIDPGLRTGCKIVSIDETGQFLENTTFYLTSGAGKKIDAEAIILAMIYKHKPTAIAIGNGTGGRETETFIRQTIASIIKKATEVEKEIFSNIVIVPVNESGASIYSASDVAREEFPELDLTVRGAISIARRLQDPLAELVKIDPKSIGVGQYQHDVMQTLLNKKLGEVVESCVNHVGVDLNTASAPLLSFVAGITKNVAKKIVAFRDKEGAFEDRKRLLKVGGFGPKAFEQAAGFLRIRNPKHPLDGSGVHPERYALVETMAKDADFPLTKLIGNKAVISNIDLNKYVNDEIGLPTLKDIVDELQKPGRDPRKMFEPPKFREDVHSIKDLKVGMELEGVVTNVTAFGAFVDIGVHQDGLVHISQLADEFVANPQDVVKPGDKIKVRVLEFEVERKRISLTAKKEADPNDNNVAGASGNRSEPRQTNPRNKPERGQKQFRNKDAKPRSKSDYKGKKGNPSRNSGGKGRGGSKNGGFANNPFAGLSLD